jgi:hypothetical protein
LGGSGLTSRYVQPAASKAAFADALEPFVPLVPFEPFVAKTTPAMIATTAAAPTTQPQAGICGSPPLSVRVRFGVSRRFGACTGGGFGVRGFLATPGA